MVVALVVFGPARLPEMARNLGKTISQLRQTAGDLKSEFESGFDVSDEDDDESPRSGEVRGSSRETAEVIPDVPSASSRPAGEQPNASQHPTDEITDET